MENEAIKQEIDALIAAVGEDPVVAKPAAERAVLEQIRRFLDRTREQRTGSARGLWEIYLPYAARLSLKLTQYEAGWENELDYFASENGQFWLDCAGASVESGDIAALKNALAQALEAARLMKRDRIAQEDTLLQALDLALEISDKKRSIQLYEEAEKVYRAHLAGGAAYSGSAWLRKIKKFGQQLAQYKEKLRRYYQYAETVTVAIEADSQGDLERVIDYLQQSLAGRVKVTRRAKETDRQDQPSGRARARIKITLE